MNFVLPTGRQLSKQFIVTGYGYRHIQGVAWKCHPETETQRRQPEFCPQLREVELSHESSSAAAMPALPLPVPSNLSVTCDSWSMTFQTIDTCCLRNRRNQNSSCCNRPTALKLSKSYDTKLEEKGQNGFFRHKEDKTGWFDVTEGDKTDGLCIMKYIYIYINFMAP